MADSAQTLIIGISYISGKAQAKARDFKFSACIDYEE